MFAWLMIFLLFPFFNRDVLRAGDLVAGTWVVEMPRRKLEQAMSLGEAARGHSLATGADYRFGDAELSIYGEYELQTLERVLREENEAAQVAVARCDLRQDRLGPRIGRRARLSRGLLCPIAGQAGARHALWQTQGRQAFLRPWPRRRSRAQNRAIRTSLKSCRGANIMLLRPATTMDVPALTALARDSFVDKFGHLYKPQDLAMFLEEYRTKRHYRQQLADPGTLIQLGEEDGHLLGYCVLVLGDHFEERPAPQPQRPALLGQLYCAPGTTGRGLGSALMEWALAEARAWRADAVQLSVYSGNIDAQRFYRRFGFKKVADIDFWVGNHRDDEFLMEVAL